MELRQLSYFLAVVRFKSFTKAAKYCFVTQSTLSEQIKALEQEIGFQLLIRQNRGNELTQAGTVLFESASKIMDEMEKMKSQLGKFNQNNQNLVRLGSLSTFVISWLPDFLYQFRQEHPNIQIELSEGGSSRLQQDLEESNVDLILTTLSAETKKYQQMDLYQEELVAILPEQLASFALDSFVHLRDLQSCPFVIYRPGFQLRHLIFDACKQQGFVPKIAFEADHTETIFRLVQSGHGVALLPRTALEYRINSDEKDRFYSVLPAVFRQVGLAYISTRNHGTDLLIQALANYFKYQNVEVEIK